MRKNILSLFLLFFIYHNSFAQAKISGYVSSHDNKPISFATVYINSTTIGTITNNDGFFELTIPYYPCELIVSHINYKTTSRNLESHNETVFNITAHKKINEIEAVTVVDKNQREENLRLFKLHFLGNNYQEDQVTIKNEDQIIFKREFTQESLDKTHLLSKHFKPNINGEWSSDSTTFNFKVPTKLMAICNIPLKVYVPQLGYEIQISLVNFYHIYKNRETYYSGYYYFKENQTTKRIQKKRNNAYFNSAQHFCRSLYKNELKKNGYEVLKKAKDSIITIDLNQHLQITNNYANITNLNGEDFHILYYGKSNASPINLNIKQPKMIIPIQSQIYFKTDTCSITSNGIIPNNHIIFSPTIGLKRVGKMLPDNFIPYNL